MSEDTLNQDLSEIVTGNYLLVNVTVRTYGGTRKDAEVTDEIHRAHNASDTTGTYIRRLFGKKNARLDEVRGAYNALRNFMYHRTLPWVSDTTGNAKGDRLLPVTESLQFIADFADLKKTAAELREKMAADLDTIITQARATMGSMAPDLSEYPDAHEFVRKFDATLEVCPVPAVKDFSRLAVPGRLAQGLQKIYEKRMNRQVDNAKADSIVRVLKALDKMHRSLHAEAIGKTRLFQSLIDNLVQDNSLFVAMYAPEGGDLAAVGIEIQQTLLDITDIKVFKGNAALSRKYSQQARALAASIRGEDTPAEEDVVEVVAPVVNDLDAKLDAALADMDGSDNDATPDVVPIAASTMPEGDEFIGEPDTSASGDSEYVGQPDEGKRVKKFGSTTVGNAAEDIDFDDFLM